jgi:uncharacterized protein (DUF2252 family)
MSGMHSAPAFQHRASRRARHQAGESRRKDYPLDSHADLVSADSRPDPVQTLGAQDAERLTDLVPIRYGRMSETPFTFYRGTAAIMAGDLGPLPRTDLEVQLCGDAHLSNFGIFNAPDRTLVFDVNDFDETLPGPFEWDLKRLAASMVVAGRQSEFTGKETRSAARWAVRGYRKSMVQAAEMTPLQLHYSRLEFDSLVDVTRPSDKGKKRARKLAEKATKKNSLRALNKLTDIVDGRRVIVSDPPLVNRVDHLFDSDEGKLLASFFESYRETLSLEIQVLIDRFSVVDMAQKVVGVGSVGMRALIVLMESGDGTPLFLQFKEATKSVLEPHLPPSGFDHAGQRVVEGQRLTQATSDIFLGWSRYDPARRSGKDGPIDFYFRQLWDGKGSADVDSMDPRGLKRYGYACGSALALAHARSGDAMMISGYIGDDKTLDHAIAEFGDGYADFNQSDYDAVEDAIDSGKIEVVRDI